METSILQHNWNVQQERSSSPLDSISPTRIDSPNYSERLDSISNLSDHFSLQSRSTSWNQSFFSPSVTSTTKEFCPVEKEEEEDRDDDASKRGLWARLCSSKCRIFIIGSIIGALLGGIALAIVLSLFLKHPSTTTVTTTTSTTTTTTTSTTTTTTTSTTTTTTTSTTTTTTTSTTTTTTTSTTTTSTTTTTTTSTTTTTTTTTTTSTSTSSTTSTSTTSTSTTSSTSTSSTTTTSTSTSSTTFTSTTSETSTTTSETTTSSTTSTSTASTTSTVTTVMIASGCNIGSTMIDFDDLLTASIPTGYNSIDWSNANVLTTTTNNSGYYTGTVTRPYTCFNPGGTPMTITPTNNQLISLYSLDIAAAWYDNLQLTVTGYYASTVVVSNIFTLQVFTLSQLTFTGYVGLNSIKFSTSGGTKDPNVGGSGTHFAMDNLCLTVA